MTVKKSNSPMANPAGAPKPQPVKASAAPARPTPAPLPSVPADLAPASPPMREPLANVTLSPDEEAFLQSQEAAQVLNQPRRVSRDGARIPFGGQSSRFPELPVKEGMHRRWFNDVRDRIARAERAGYTHVLMPDGQPFTAEGGFYDGRSIKIYAMELPMAFRDEDLEAVQDRLDAIDQMIYLGKHKEEPGDKRYVSDGAAINAQIRTGPGR